MNKYRRTELKKIIDRLNEVKNDLSAICDEERDAMENLPENLQESDRRYAMEEAADNMEAAGDSIDDAIGIIEDVIDA